MYGLRGERHLARGNKRERFGRLVSLCGKLVRELVGEFRLDKFDKLIFKQLIKFIKLVKFVKLKLVKQR